MARRLEAKYAPQRLADICGQPLAEVHAWLADPDSRCWLLVGPPGTGKTSTAAVIATELGADGPASGLARFDCGNMPKEDLVAFVTSARRFARPLAGQWWVLLLEEFERLHPLCQVFLKSALDELERPRRLVVVATSNRVGGLDEALLERFDRITFRADLAFARACGQRLAAIWSAEFPGQERPAEARLWGWADNRGDKSLCTGSRRFSMRQALRDMQRWAERHAAVAVAC